MATTYQKYHKNRMENEPEFRAKMMTAIKVCKKKRYNNDEEYRDKMKNQSKDIYRNNETYRQSKIDKALERYYEKKANKFYQTLFD